MGRLQTARLENFIRRWGSIKGGGSLLSETLGEVFPVLDLENLTPENQLPAGWSLFWGTIAVTGVAAQLAGASIINPANSGNLAVIDDIKVRRQTTGLFTVGTSLALFTPTINIQIRDTRSTRFSGALRIAGNANVSGAETGLILRTVASVDTSANLPHALAVLAPGTQLAVVNNTVNDDLTVNFYGRVRVAEPSELSF